MPKKSLASSSRWKSMQSQPETLKSCTNAYMVPMWYEKKKERKKDNSLLQTNMYYARQATKIGDFTPSPTNWKSTKIEEARIGRSKVDECLCKDSLIIDMILFSLAGSNPLKVLFSLTKSIHYWCKISYQLEEHPPL